MHSWIERISTFLGLRLICGQHGAATDARPPAEEDSTQFSAKLQNYKMEEKDTKQDFHTAVAKT